MLEAGKDLGISLKLELPIVHLVSGLCWKKNNFSYPKVLRLTLKLHIKINYKKNNPRRGMNHYFISLHYHPLFINPLLLNTNKYIRYIFVILSTS